MAGPRLALPERKRRYGFALTPLADALFQLLVFFMLSSSLTPYSLLPMRSGQPLGSADGQADPPGAGADADAAAASPQGQSDLALWVVEADQVIVGAQRFDMGQLGALAEALAEARALGETAPVVVMVRASARVQDVTTVLARLRSAGIDGVQITPEAF